MWIDLYSNSVEVVAMRVPSPKMVLKELMPLRPAVWSIAKLHHAPLGVLK